MENPTNHSINYQQFDFALTAKEPLILPTYKGSTFRGGFGYAFKRVVCVIRDKECQDCILKEKCVYSYVFETPPPSDTKIMRKYKSAPHPFVIEPPLERRRGYKPGDEINFGLTLIGRAIDYLPYFIYTFDELGKIGIGKGKARYELRNVFCDGKIIYDSESKTLKSFKTSSFIFDSSLVIAIRLRRRSNLTFDIRGTVPRFTDRAKRGGRIGTVPKLETFICNPYKDFIRRPSHR